MLNHSLIPLLANWDPLSLIRNYDESLAANQTQTSAVIPRINLWADDDKVVFEAEVPGVAPEDISLSLEDRVLTLRAERKNEAAPEGAAVYRAERWEGSYERQVRLPYRVDGDKIEAVCKNGVLKVTVPRAQADKSRKIAIQAH